MSKKSGHTQPLGEACTVPKARLRFLMKRFPPGLTGLAHGATMKISIIIPTKDRPEELPGALASARAALPSGGGGEIIIVDDGSKVHPKAVLGDCGESVSVIDNPGPAGPAGARNAGVARARFPVCLFLDDDDRLFPDCCTRILAVAADHPEVLYGTFSHVLRTESPVSAKRDDVTPAGSRIVGSCGLWVRRETFLEVGGFDADLWISEDHELCIRLVRMKAPMWFDAKPGFAVTKGRKGHANLARRIPPGERVRCYRKILSKHGRFLADNAPSWRRRFVFRIWKYRAKALVDPGVRSGPFLSGAASL